MPSTYLTEISDIQCYVIPSMKLIMEDELYRLIITLKHIYFCNVSAFDRTQWNGNITFRINI